MTISPWAMLMTPMTPKVMARPMAASSSTEPSDSPYQTFCAADHRARSPSTRRTASAMAEPSASLAPLEAASRIARVSWLLLAAMVFTASIFTASEASLFRMAAARARSMTARTLSFCSAAIASVSGSTASGSPLFSTDWAAAMRMAGSGLRRVRVPMAARTARRRLLFTRTLATSRRPASPALVPVSGSVSRYPSPPRVAMKTALSERR